MVTINNKLDPICGLYYKNKFAGIIKNNTALLDVCSQICQEQLEGYSVRFKGKNYEINKDGRIFHVPEGFYDSADKSLKIIMGF